MLCIDRPLEGSCTVQQLLVVTLKTAKDCEDYLWQNGKPELVGVHSTAGMCVVLRGVSSTLFCSMYSLRGSLAVVERGYNLKLLVVMLSVQ